MIAVVQLDQIAKRGNACRAVYTHGGWDRLELETSSCAPDGVADVEPEYHAAGRMVRAARTAIWKQCPPPCCTTLVDLEEP
jgi:hypothetical protein